MGSKNSTARSGGQGSYGGRQGNEDGRSASAHNMSPNTTNAPGNHTMPAHLASQYSTNNPRRRASNTNTTTTTTAANNNNNNNAAANTEQGNSAQRNATPSQPQLSATSQQAPAAPRTNNTNNNNNGNTNERGVQEGQMVKLLATIEASTVAYNAETQLLTFYITSTCPSLTYEIHTGVKMFVQDGTVFYMPNKPKMEPTRTAIEGPQENRKITVKLDVSKLEEKEKAFNKHYQKQMPCVIVLRYRTTELRNTDNGEGEEVVVEHTEHTAVDLAEKPKRRVISQIVTAGGNAYVVENLYGADSDTLLAGGDEMNEVMVGSTIVPHEGEEDEEGLCVICITNPKDTAVMPCRHMCMCKSCGEELLKHKPVCPVCRAPISTLLHMPSLAAGNTTTTTPPAA